MKNILDAVDFDIHLVYEIKLNIYDSYMFKDIKEGAALEDEHGQSLDAISDVRRTIKYSFPFDNKKIIKSINIEDETEDEYNDLCRNIKLHYYLLIDKEEQEEFCTEELHDELEEEWRDGSECEIEITLLDVHSLNVI